MNDNVTLPINGTGGTTNPVFATENIGGVQYQKIKLIDGKDDSTLPLRADMFAQLAVTQMTRLCGGTFVGQTRDTVLWTDTVSNGATVTQSGGAAFLRTGTSANGWATSYSVQKGRYQAGAASYFRGVIKLDDMGAANNVRRWGAFDATDGAFFELNGTTLRVVTRRNAVDTPVTQASWNGSAFTFDTNAHVYEIWWRYRNVHFYIDGSLVHTATFLTVPWMLTATLGIGMENTNSGGGTANVVLSPWHASINRFGYLKGETFSVYIAGATNTVCKRSAGRLHRIIIGNNVGTVVAYDNLTGTGTPIIASFDATKVYGSIDLDVSFNTGLSVVPSSTAQVTVVLE